MNAPATFATLAAKDAAFWQRIDAEYAAQAIHTAEAVIAASAALLVRDPWRRKGTAAMNANPRIGNVKVADLAADYGSTGFAIEEYGYHNLDEPCWAVPAWDERGLGHLCGPLPCGAFATREEAETALRETIAEWAA